MIISALNDTNGNILLAAKKLQISRAGLHKMIKRFDITPKNMST